MSKPAHRYRIFFTKTAEARFIGHLDLQSLFQKAIRRAALPVAYSEGFNPHQILSFAAPLPLGMAGLGEILEAYMTQKVDLAHIAASLNPKMPVGITISSAIEIPPTGKGGAALTHAATYSIIFPFNESLAAQFDTIINQILSKTTIEMTKKTKKGLSVANIRPDILAIKNTSSSHEISLLADLSTGSARNLKPEILSKYILDTAGISMDDLDITYVRLSLHLGEATS
ncbi:MAG: TIGR03936 family radical SAM-associated protein [Defluviitaleaceae bacterium]|nr:TIGR03936 family radical SAM-associated protein [Defluviitaleaceae bacterium]